MKSTPTIPTLAALRRGFAILKRLAQNRRGCTFSDLRGAAGDVTAASLSRLLKVMIADGLVAREEDSGIYRLGENFLALARESVGVLSPAEIISPLLDRLAQDTGESAAWFERGDTYPFLAAKSEVADGFHYIPVGQHIHRVLPHGFGMVIAAWAGEDFVARHGPLPLPEAEYRRLLTQIRNGRLLLEDIGGERRPVRVVAPVFRGAGGEVLGALGITIFGKKPTGDRRRLLEEAVTAAAREATTKIGETQ